MAVLPTWITRYWRHFLLIKLCLIAAVLAKAHVIHFESYDYRAFLNGWLAHIKTHGLAHAYGVNFTNYLPLYTYMLGIANALLPDVSGVYVVKILTFAGEVLAAFYAYRIVALEYGKNSVRAWGAGVGLLALPTVIANGASVGQCDIWYTACLLAAMDGLMRKKPERAVTAFAIALSLKLQALFFAPFLLACLLAKIIPWRLLWIIPAVYLATCIPAWVEGRPLIDMLNIFRDQLGFRERVNISAGNPYIFLHKADFLFVVVSGAALSIAAGLWLANRVAQALPAKTTIEWMLPATLSLALMPYLLPMMHDRYFFPADIFSFILAMLRPRWFLLPVLFQTASLLAYHTLMHPPISWPPINANKVYLELAAGLNAVAIGLLIWFCATYNKGNRHGTPISA